MDLIEAVINNDIEQVQKLLAEGTNPNMYLDADKLRPLHFAAQNNALDVAPLLIEAGADIHACTVPDKQTPIDVAKLHNHKAMVILLETFDKNSR